jgi:uncharacterized protein YdaU (DUF1376 family)
MHYYQFNIADYRKDTIHLTPIEHYAYRQLLDQYYLTELPIPLEEDKVMRSLCVRIADDMQAVRNVLQDFFLKTENGYIHKRCDIEIEAYHAKSKSASDSAKARWAKKNVPDNVIAMRSHTEGNANHKPLTINQEPIKPKNITPFALLSAMDVEEQYASAWIRVRKEKKQAITQPALDKIKAHAEKHGFTMNNAIKICCEQSWAGFNVKWLEGLQQEESTPKCLEGAI